MGVSIEQCDGIKWSKIYDQRYYINIIIYNGIMECSKENSGKSTHLIYFLKKLGNDSKEAFHLNNAKLLKCWLTILQK